MTGSQLCAAHSQLTQYKDKYGARLKVPHPVLGILIGQKMYRSGFGLGSPWVNPNPDLVLMAKVRNRFKNIFLDLYSLDNITSAKIHIGLLYIDIFRI